ncbi:sensor histidine kinase [Bosea lathyri]|nr:7TM diverse intracellular signaling domain-containing protein [Bosea lathyri]
MTPPAEGWTSVALPDDWSKRWSDFSGVVWYRLRFSVDEPDRPRDVMFDYWTLAGAVWLNGALLHRDASLVEPLSRSWNVTRLFTLSAPLLRKGENELLIRVSGLAGQQPGLGSVTLGAEGELRAQFSRIILLRHGVPMFGLALSAMLGLFFFVVWAMRRSETAYGWFALFALAWSAYLLNQLVESPWPFATSGQWARGTILAFTLACTAFFIFMFRFAERRFPRWEALIWSYFLLSSAILIFIPEERLEAARIILSISFVFLFLAISALFLALTWRSRRLDYIGLNLCNIVVLAIGVHDLSLFSGLIPGTMYVSGFASPLRAICMAVVLAWHFVGSLSRVERFNADLVAKVAVARQELAQTLGQQHELALAATRMEERAQLTHNLHDGLGGALVSNIALLEHDPARLAPERFLAMLKELRDELRLVIDVSSGESGEQRTIVEVLAPLRRRYGLLFESCDISCRWAIDELEDRTLSSRQSLDLTRFVQEGLTNVIKHSRATIVDVSARGEGGRLCLTIADNGRGFVAAGTEMKGAGLDSLQARAKRLGGKLTARSDPAGTHLQLVIPV